MLLKELFESDTKHVAFCFGRMNPPTIGHAEVFKKLKSIGGDYKIFVTLTQDKKENPLDYSTKTEFIKLIHPEYADNLVVDSSLNTIGKVCSYLYDQGYRNATFVAGSDRLPGFKKLITDYNGVEGKPHGYYKFDVLDFESSGQRDPDSSGVAGISASKAREKAVAGDLDGFAEATGAGDYAKELYDAVRKGMGVSESTMIESVSVSSAVKNITATGDSIAKVYDDLKSMAEKWVYNNGHLKGFHRNAAGVAKRWYNTFFWNKMENDLRTLLEKNPKGADKLKDFFNIERDDKGHVSFNIIGKSLPKILYQVGERMQEKELQRFASNWYKRQQDYESFLSKIESEADEDEDDTTTTAKTPKDNIIGKQNASAEDIVNNILGKINKKAAGEIRNVIAREPNKLQALQRELSKRNINVEESWKSKVAGAALAAANLLGSTAQAAEEPVKPITIATVIIDGEARRYNLGDKFSSAREAEEFITNVLSKQGLQGYQLEIKRGYPKKNEVKEGYGRYWCSTDKKWKTRKGPKQKRSS